MKKQQDLSKFVSLTYPKMSVVVTCNKEADTKKVNAITVTWHTPLSMNPPLYGVSIAPSRYSHGLIVKNKEFAINFLGFEHWKKLHYCGTHSGGKEDKIKNAGLNLEDCKYIKTKMLKEAYLSIECKLYKTINLGDHDLFVGEILAAHLDETKKREPIYEIKKPRYTKIDSTVDVQP
jgi:flavin reductase (DIM6/NTAB) family NADH-FMN oxidoreductase RutF